MNALVLATHDVDLRAHDRVVRTNDVGLARMNAAHATNDVGPRVHERVVRTNDADLVRLAPMAVTNAGDVETNRPLNSELVRRLHRKNVRKRVMNPRSELRQNLNNAL